MKIFPVIVQTNSSKSLDHDDYDDDGTLDDHSQVMTSKDTRFNPGSGRTPGWRNKLGDVQRGAAQKLDQGFNRVYTKVAFWRIFIQV